MPKFIFGGHMSILCSNSENIVNNLTVIIWHISYKNKLERYSTRTCNKRFLFVEFWLTVGIWHNSSEQWKKPVTSSLLKWFLETFTSTFKPFCYSFNSQSTTVSHYQHICIHYTSNIVAPHSIITSATLEPVANILLEKTMSLPSNML